ncbi:MAG: GAF domain-containing protein [Rubrivivax sp.]|jgi:hypothetical protein|nr:MAG: GAF domain-containing protein [Rubrivivax sp.]
MYERPFTAHSLDVAISELLAATADGFDPDLDARITGVLKGLREQLHMDVVFVSEFQDGERVFRFVDGQSEIEVQVGDSAPLEQSYCQRIVEGRAPELMTNAAAVAAELKLPPTPVPIGAHLSAPVVLSDGRVFGTVCCFSVQPNPGLRSEDLSRLKGCARLVARKVEAQDFLDTLPFDND